MTPSHGHYGGGEKFFILGAVWHSEKQCLEAEWVDNPPDCHADVAISEHVERYA